MDSQALEKLAHDARKLPSSLDALHVVDAVNIESTIKKDKELLRYIAALNVDNLEERTIDFSRDETLVYCLENLIHHLQTDLGSRFRFQGHVTRIGSCIDGSKVSKVNEMDCLYTISANIKTKRTEHENHFKIHVGGSEIRPSLIVDDFAESVEQSVTEWIKSVRSAEDRRLGTFLYDFVGVRYNGPAVTMVFSSTNLDAKQFISLDLTTSFSLPEDLHSVVKANIYEKLSVVQKEHTEKLYTHHGLYLVPNLVDDDWQLSTAQLEADLLRALPDTAPMKRAFNYSKIISHDLEKINEKCLVHEILQKVKEPCEESQEYRTISLNLGSWKSQNDKRMRHVHTMMSQEDAVRHEEQLKSNMSINTAALKHILLATSLKNPEAFKKEEDEDLVYTLVMEAYKTLSDSKDFRIPHALLPCNIGMFGVAGYRALLGCGEYLLQAIRAECQEIHNKIKQKVTDIHIWQGAQARTTHLNEYLVPASKLQYPEYIFEVPTDFSMSPNRNPRLIHVRQLVNALTNTCGGIVDVLGKGNITATALIKWIHGFQSQLSEDYQNHAEDFVLLKDLSPVTPREVIETVHLRLFIRPSPKQINFGESESVSYEVTDSGSVVQRYSSQPDMCEASLEGSQLVATSSSNEPNVTSADHDALPHLVHDLHDVDQFLQKEVTISWTSCTKNWDTQIGATKPRISDRVYDLLNNCDMLKPATPMHVTPTISASRLPPQMKTSLEEICSMKKTRGCAFWSKNWLSNIEHDSCVLNAGLGTVDLLCFEEDNRQPFQLWSVSASVAREIELESYWSHLMVSGRITKKVIFDRLRQARAHGLQTGDPFLHTSLSCRVYNGPEGEVPNGNQSDALDPWYTDTDFPEGEIKGSLRASLGLALLSKNTSLKVGLNDSILIQLTYEQSQNVKAMANCKFNFIEGPPGSGKTIMAFYICDQYRKENSVYVCTTSQFRSYVDYQGKAEAFLVKDGHELCTLLEKTKLGSCLILDDVQNLPYSEGDWTRTLAAVAKRDVDLFVFVDCDYQNYRFRANTKGLRRSFIDFCEDHDISYNTRRLSEILRNTKKVASFLSASISGTTKGPTITCANDAEGGDIEIKRVSNLTSPGAENGLLAYLRDITGGASAVTEQFYAPEQIAILVDDTFHDGHLDLFRDVINNHSPFTAHDASVFPRTGIVVENLDDFVGLDAQVCVFPFWEHNLRENKLSEAPHTNRAGDVRSFECSQYKIFIASRAVHHVAFVTEEVLDHTIATAMKLDNLPITREPRIDDNTMFNVNTVGDFMGRNDMSGLDEQLQRVNSPGYELRKHPHLVTVSDEHQSVTISLQIPGLLVAKSLFGQAKPTNADLQVNFDDSGAVLVTVKFYGGDYYEYKKVLPAPIDSKKSRYKIKTDQVIMKLQKSTMESWARHIKYLCSIDRD